ncbi:MAG TPA: hypothetical protein VGD87_13505, partial [Archangium sp.]
LASAGLGLGPYLVLLEPVDGAGACAEVKHFSAGLQRFRPADGGTGFEIGVKTSLVADPSLGYVFEGNADPSNDCVNEEDCRGATSRAASCVVTTDAGLALFDGTPVSAPGVDGGATAMEADGGTVDGVDPRNLCTWVKEPILREDPADPAGANRTSFAHFTQYPVDGVCRTEDWRGGVQDYAEVALSLEDGGTSSLPAVRYQVEWSDFRVFMTDKVQGTAFKADLRYTEGGCTANYKATGIWPAHECKTDGDCDPQPNADEGRVFGSGLNPEFKPVCNVDLGYCVPSVDVATIE